MENAVDKNKPLSLTDFLRKHFKGILDPIGKFFNRLGVRPNTMTLLGLLGSTIGAVLFAQGEMFLGGVVVLIMGPVDALDGTMARLRGESSEFGAFVDSVTDRYSELVIMGGLLVYYLMEQDWMGASLVYLAAVGSFLVSYVRARGYRLFGRGWLTPLVETSFGFDSVNHWIVLVVTRFAERLRATQTGQLNWNILGIVSGQWLVVLVILWLGVK